MNYILEHTHNSELGKLFLRLALGIVFLNSGLAKIGNMEQVVGFFGTLGFSAWLAYAVAYIETLGGIFLLLGLFVRHSSFALAIIMLVATLKVHLPNGYSLKGGGYEYTLVLMLGSLAVMYLGSGRYSLDQLLSKFLKKKSFV